MCRRSADPRGWGMTVPNQGEWLAELLRQVAQQLSRMAVGYDQIATELHRANLIELQSIFVERLDRAIDDPTLALSSITGLSDEKRRQMLNANAQYSLILMAHRVGHIDRSELLGYLKVLHGNDAFAEYWQRSAAARWNLPSDSFEARVGRAVDAIMDERLEDIEEWWVVGSEADGA